MVLGVAVLGATVCLAVTGCSGEPAPVKTVTMVVATPAQPPAPSLTLTPLPTPELPSAAVPTAPVVTVTTTVMAPPAAAATHPKTTKVPNGVGMNYQAAQDLWRGNGLVVLPAIDALGAHRLPVIDSNWVVLAQDLKAGSTVDWGSSIRATVKKYTDE